ncbi:thiamine biosynthesis protein ThiI [Seinonella peptonophila]|uniref:Probable tRNA sulfurtransferase n=1 Tax=Seinonella peptonophila TaxID=112248 RepID=A0A1M4V509_9BACL|nr:tRNA uracil 4-sulfurtransferase ThiI [Seinonella peptonophila]SHE64064.1 thiamine biosynthesis protein ThiI [Seinonella peptonophila]
MKYDAILLRYGELALKKKNRRMFEEQLILNIKEKLQLFPNTSLEREFGRLFVVLENEQEPEPIIEKLKEVFGLVGFSPARRVSSDLEEIKKATLDIALNQPSSYQSFKIESKRSDKQFPIRSQQLNHELGGYVLANTERFAVDVRNPDLVIHVEVRGKFSYVYGNDILGLGGLPVGTSGRVLLLLSGGIDSPVAGYLTSKRGVELHAIHFHSYPYTSERAKQKVVDLAHLLTPFSGTIHLHVVPFTEIQTEINQHCLSSYSVTIMRRFMLRISEAIAKKHGCLALVTGESLGQVASQTLESMHTINAVTHYPLLRPLVGMDKVEITKISKEIGTYETSILPYEDCCTIFLPKNPKTRPTIQAAVKQESALKIDELVSRAVEGTELIVCETKHEEEFDYF